MYDDFSRIPRTAAAAAQSAGQPRPPGAAPGMPGGPGGEGLAPGMGGEPGIGPAGMEGGEPGVGVGAPGAPGMPVPPPALPAADLRTRFLTWLQRMDMAIAKDPQVSGRGQRGGAVGGDNALGTAADWLVCACEAACLERGCTAPLQQAAGSGRG